uniref:PXMP2/4 family protein 4-like n=1 Tax=Nelumbo nucifera TaxID=4432 RepID=A0A822ZA71_NELNU|nr:TPA_asm: hypothetical protein HUJ06_015783 [Nelumbo nucifera]
MSGGWFLRNVGKRYLHPLLERRSLPNSFVSTEAPILAKQQSRTYSPIPLLLFRKVKESGNTTSFYPSSRFFSSSSSSSSNSFIGWYLGMIESRPVLTKSITAGLIYSVADLSAQRMTQTSSESFDLIRTLRMTGYGMLFMGPSLHFWFNFLSRVFPKLDVVTTLKKLIMGQVIYGPIVTATFFSLNAALQGELRVINIINNA